MTEKLLQFIWQLRHFNQQQLVTIQGNVVEIIYPGILNTNQGPDFLVGKLMIDNYFWVGSIELHLKTSDWEKHAHQQDSNYKNVILHVVWENDLPETNPFNLPTLELNHRVSSILLARYESMMMNACFIPCEKSVKDVSALVWSAWKERLLIERLQRKTNSINLLLSQNNYDWQETLWWLVAKSFGLKVNAEAFEEIARSIPTNLLHKHTYQIHQLEARLLGQAGLLNKEFTEAYPQLLQREYRFLQKKYRFRPVNVPILFLRMRPSNFPSVRLAQLAMLIVNIKFLFSYIKECEDLGELQRKLKVTANDYWNYHYRLDEASDYKPKTVGDTMIYTVLINAIIPILYCYGEYYKDMDILQKTLRWMDELPAEKNHISKSWQNLGIVEKSAFDSQALLELKSIYCDSKRCLDCSIGNAILQKVSQADAAILRPPAKSILAKENNINSS